MIDFARSVPHAGSAPPGPPAPTTAPAASSPPAPTTPPGPPSPPGPPAPPGRGSLGDEIARLSAHIEAATGRLLALIREFDASGEWHE